jgi:hypothetical protein
MWGLGAMGPFLQVAGMIMMVVVVLRGLILQGTGFSEAQKKL